MARRDRSYSDLVAATERAPVGREGLLAELRSASAEASAGRGSFFLLQGEAGIGKSTVVRAVADGAGPGLRVTWGSCASGGGAPPFWPWLELLDASEVPASPAGGEPADRARHERLNQLRDAVLLGVADQPTLHVIEDLQWADVASVLLLAHLAPGLERVPLLLVATLRTASRDAPRSWIRFARPSGYPFIVSSARWGRRTSRPCCVRRASRPRIG